MATAQGQQPGLPFPNAVEDLSVVTTVNQGTLEALCEGTFTLFCGNSIAKTNILPIIGQKEIYEAI